MSRPARGGIAALRAAIKNQRLDFRQKNSDFIQKTPSDEIIKIK